MTIGEWLSAAQQQLRSNDCDSAALDASLLAAHALGISRSELLAHPELPVPENLDALVRRRASGEPIAYILGYREFFMRRFIVDSRVLIPRPETETLVQAAISRIPRRAVVLDIGTGSGAIAITLALERPDLNVVASDADAGALEVARRNDSLHSADVPLVLMDRLSALRHDSLDAIVSNPPYIDPSDPNLEDSVRLFEPHAAIFSRGGMEFIERMVADAKLVLRRGGALLFEFGVGQREKVASCLKDWTDVSFIRDLSGRARVVLATRV